MWIWRRMMKVSWTEHKTNEEVLQMVNTEREMMDTLRSRQKRWLGHILRHDSLLRITLEGPVQGKKVVEDQEQGSWIGYWRQRKTRSVMMNWRCWHNQIKMVSVKMETCHMGRILQQQQQWQCSVLSDTWLEPHIGNVKFVKCSVYRTCSFKSLNWPHIITVFQLFLLQYSDNVNC